jgi:hypothetical protein
MGRAETIERRSNADEIDVRIVISKLFSQLVVFVELGHEVKPGPPKHNDC